MRIYLRNCMGHLHGLNMRLQFSMCEIIESRPIIFLANFYAEPSPHGGKIIHTQLLSKPSKDCLTSLPTNYDSNSHNSERRWLYFDSPQYCPMQASSFCFRVPFTSNKLHRYSEALLFRGPVEYHHRPGYIFSPNSYINGITTTSEAKDHSSWRLWLVLSELHLSQKIIIKLTH